MIAVRSSQVFAGAKALGAALLLLTLTGPREVQSGTPGYQYEAGVWVGWQDIDQGGFEDKGTVSWHAEYDGCPGRRSYYLLHPVQRPFWKLCVPRKLPMPLVLEPDVATRVVLDQAIATGGQVHISGRRRSGLSPGCHYVMVQRATPVGRLR